MKLLREHPWYSEANAQRLVSLCFCTIALIGVLNAVLLLFAGIDFLYLIPLVIVAPFLSRWQLLVITLICTTFAEGFSHLPGGPERILRVAFIFVAYGFVAFLVRALVIYRRAASRELKQMNMELSEFHDAEQRLQSMINSSVLGMITISPEGRIVACNRAAHEIFSVEVGGLLGKSASSFLPFGQTALLAKSGPLEGKLTRADGRSFYARVWTSRFSSDGIDVTGVIVEPLNDNAIMERDLNHA